MRRLHALLAVFALAGAEAPCFAEDEDPAPAVTVEGSYTADLWAALDGGSDHGLRYLDDLAVGISVDAERLFGWRGSEFYAQALYNNGTGFSETLVGDRQVVSNIEAGTRAVRLYEAWVEQRLSERFSLRFGLYDLNSEFDANETGALFLNSSHGIGPDFSQSGENGPSIFPSTSLALRAELALSETIRVRAAVLDAVPGDPERPARTAVLLREQEGALLVGEIERRWSDSKIVIGRWTYSERAPTIGRTGTGTASGTYLLAETRLAGGVADARELRGWIRVGAADADVHDIATYVGGGLVLSAPLVGRDNDAFGFAFALIHFSRAYRRVAEAERGELNLEITYRLALSERFALQPDLQLVFDPSGVRGRATAVALGLRSELRF